MDVDRPQESGRSRFHGGSLATFVSISALLQRGFARASILRRDQKPTPLGPVFIDSFPPPEYRKVVGLKQDAMRFQPHLTLKHGHSSKDGAIDWECATHGIRVLALAMDEERNPNPIADLKRQNISRKLYMDAMTYLLRAVPQDLTIEERVSVSSSLPDSLGLRVEQAALNVSSPGAEPERSILHKCLASWILSIFLVFQLLRPYLKVLLNTLLHYERKYRVTERLISVTLRAGEEAGKVMGIVREMDDGRIGDSAYALLTWWVRGVTGGLRDGVAEGVTALSSNKGGKRDGVLRW